MQLCQVISGIKSAIVIENCAGDGVGQNLVRWPEDRETEKDLLQLAIKAIESRRQLIIPNKSHNVPDADLIALPLLSDEQLMGSVALCLSARSAQKQKAAQQALLWSLRWLVFLHKQADVSHAAGMDWIEHLAGRPVSPAAIVELLAEQLQCDRVTLALGDTRRLEISATYPMVAIERETGLLQAIKEAMFEAMDQQVLLYYPPLPSSDELLIISQQSLHEKVGPATLCSIPLILAEVTIGALLLERHRQRPFTQQEQMLCQQAAGLLALLLQQRQHCDRPLLELISERLHQRLKSWLGPQGLWLKLGLPGFAVILLVSWLVEGDYRIEARANLEGRIQRVITAPFDGYLQEASVKAGDIVTRGEVLCRLDDRDLLLEQAKWQTELAKLQREQREALANHERSKVTLLQAQRQQLLAELDRVDMKLARSRIKTPLQGVIVSGDLSQSLGAPLQRGDELFKIAPLESYRVLLQVDEQDIADVQVGQPGVLRLAGYPDLEHAFYVKRILPLSTATEGSYLFTLEAELAQVNRQLRPGLQGVAKIDAGRRSLLWLAGHRVRDWLRLQLWRWWG
jgi:multidrug resistance efflux pump